MAEGVLQSARGGSGNGELNAFRNRVLGPRRSSGMFPGGSYLLRRFLTSVSRNLA